MHKIDIILATYNGDRFIENQLLSIIRQTQPDWRLLIHDDGSTDNTISILEKFHSIDKRIKIIADDVKNIGAAKNFLHLLKYSTAEYIMFCDQDDIWLENKVQLVYNEIVKKNYPALVYTNAWYLNDGKIIQQNAIVVHPKRLSNMLFLNGGVLGCSMIFNRHLLNLLSPFPSFVAMHDHFMCLAAVTFGTITYIDQPSLLYRQHSNNVTGNQERSLVKRIRTFFKKGRYVIDLNHYKGVQSFLATYDEIIEEKERHLFLSYFDYAEKASLLKRLLIIFENKFKIGNSIITLFIKTILRSPLSPN